MGDAFEAMLSDGSGFQGRVTVRLARGEVFVDDLAGATIVRLPVSRINEMEVNSDRALRGRNRHRTGPHVTLSPVDGKLVRLHPLGTADAGTVFDAIGGDDAALTRLNDRGVAYRRFVLDLARDVKARRGRVKVARRGYTASPLKAVLFMLVGAGLIGWQAYEPKTFAIYALGGAMLAAGIVMLVRSPGARPREVDGSEASLDAYLPKPPA